MNFPKIRKEVEGLQAEIGGLQEENKNLKSDNETLQKENQILIERVVAMKQSVKKQFQEKLI